MGTTLETNYTRVSSGCLTRNPCTPQPRGSSSTNLTTQPSSIYANGMLWVLPDRVWDQPKTGGSGCGFGFVMASFAGTSEQTRSFRGIRLRSVVPAIPNYMLETTHKDPRHTTNPNSKNRQETQSAGNTCPAPQPYRRDRRSIEDSDTLRTSVDPLPSIISLQR